MMRVLSARDVAGTSTASREHPRGRCNFNLHPELSDPIQRFLNVMQPGSYVRPHHHEPERFELFLLLAGRAAALVFDDAGEVVESVILETNGARAVEIPGGVCHTLFALDEDTLLFEVKPGPYRAPADKDFAAWAPREGAPETAELLARWQALIER